MDTARKIQEDMANADVSAPFLEASSVVDGMVVKFRDILTMSEAVQGLRGFEGAGGEKQIKGEMIEVMKERTKLALELDKLAKKREAGLGELMPHQIFEIDELRKDLKQKIMEADKNYNKLRGDLAQIIITDSENLRLAIDGTLTTITNENNRILAENAIKMIESN